MRGSDNIVFKIMENFVNFIILNVIWLLFCLPVITFFPASKAMMGVSRNWVIEKVEGGVLRQFLDCFKEDFRKSFLIGLMLWGIALVLWFDFGILLQAEFAGSRPLFVLLVLLSTAFIFISIYLLFLLVTYELSIKDLIKNSFLFSIANIVYTSIFVVIIAVSLFLVYLFPFLIVVLGSLTSYLLYLLFNRIVNTREEAKSIEET
ncbi:YesL family protein [Sediminibacillus massiliensis]|uniref:YesL family protein n=1 Tax=Sediminibacillus massiliensis TaxID=1926277 RepID=UPI0009888CE9|nr:DUF624 domain-containing protein [Sediminibacillus massiliensis]